MNKNLKEAMKLLGVSSALEMSREYTRRDQELMKSGKWDHENDDLIVNVVKNKLELVPLDTLNDEDRTWVVEILWFWNHHAISSALSKKQIASARKFSLRGLYYQKQSGNHPNKITRLFFFLLSGNILQAKRWASKIKDEPERSTAKDLINWYRKGYFKP